MGGRERASGQTIRCPEGYDAFIPAALPPDIEWSSPIVQALSEADRAVGQLAGEGGRLPNHHLLIRPFVRREAVLSSRIEGTQVTLGELLAQNPLWTIRGVAVRLGVAFTTAQRAVQRLADAGILEQTSDSRRDRVFCTREILEIL